MTKIPVMNIIYDSIVDGEGLRTVLFVAGCPHHCKGCHNPQSWNSKNGKMISIEDLFKMLIKNPINDITFSGGEPFLYAEELTELAKLLKAEGKNIWAWSGFAYEQLTNDKAKRKLLEEIDVLIDGRFILEQRNLSLYWKGSKNQRVLKLVNGEPIEMFNDQTEEWEEMK